MEVWDDSINRLQRHNGHGMGRIRGIRGTDELDRVGGWSRRHGDDGTCWLDVANEHRRVNDVRAQRFIPYRGVVVGPSFNATTFAILVYILGMVHLYAEKMLVGPLTNEINRIFVPSCRDFGEDKHQGSSPWAQPIQRLFGAPIHARV